MVAIVVVAGWEWMGGGGGGGGGAAAAGVEVEAVWWLGREKPWRAMRVGFEQSPCY